MEHLKLEINGKIAIVTINRPKAMNALNNGVFSEMARTLTQLYSEDAIGGVIITGEGPKAFAAGADISELKELDGTKAIKQSRLGQRLFDQIANFNKPVIAVVNGFALGGGCELALACHFRVASENAMFGLPEVGLGLIPGYAGTQRLPRVVGKGLAMEMILSGDMISAQRAYEIGLVNHIFTQEELMEKAKKLLNRILANGPIAIRAALEAVHQGLEGSLAAGQVLESNMFGQVVASNDAKEGLSAFLEKRKPAFKGE